MTNPTDNLEAFKAKLCVALRPWEGAYQGYGKDMDEAEAAITAAAVSLVVGELEKLRLDSEVTLKGAQYIRHRLNTYKETSKEHCDSCGGDHPTGDCSW